MNKDSTIYKRYEETLKKSDIMKISNISEKAVYLHMILGFPKSVLCRGKSKIISYPILQRAVESTNFGYKPGTLGRRPKLNPSQENKLELELSVMRKEKKKVTPSTIRKVVCYFTLIF
jgi:hypothetical protein